MRKPTQPPVKAAPAPKVQTLAKEEKTPLVYASLPLISCLDKPLFREARELLQELQEHEYCLDPETDKMVKRDKRTDAIKARLQEIQDEGGQPGLRFGNLAFAAVESQGRETLKPLLLIEAGVKASLIAQCTVRGASYFTKTFKVLND